MTIRHSVGAEKGRGATALAALLLLRTSWDSRSQALSGSASKNDLWTVVDGAEIPVGMGLLDEVIL